MTRTEVRRQQRKTMLSVSSAVSVRFLIFFVEKSCKTKLFCFQPVIADREDDKEKIDFHSAELSLKNHGFSFLQSLSLFVLRQSDKAMHMRTQQPFVFCVVVCFYKLLQLFC